MALYIYVLLSPSRDTPLLRLYVKYFYPLITLLILIGIVRLGSLGRGHFVAKFRVIVKIRFTISTTGCCFFFAVATLSLAFQIF